MVSAIPKYQSLGVDGVRGVKSARALRASIDLDIVGV
jgi:hypothetical protein